MAVSLSIFFFKHRVTTNFLKTLKGGSDLCNEGGGGWEGKGRSNCTNKFTFYLNFVIYGWLSLRVSLNYQKNSAK